MRLSEDTVKFIDTFDGSTFTEKFENMVRYFKDRKPAYEKDLKNLRKDIDSHNDKLMKARQNLRGIEMINNSFERLKGDMESASSCIEDFVLRNKL
jgi:hypothetical protein